ELTADEVTYFGSHKIVQFDALPLHGAGAYDTLPFQQWQRLCAFRTLRAQTLGGSPDLVDVFTATSREEALRRLAQATAWREDAIDFLTGPELFDLSVDDFHDETLLLRLAACMQLVGKLGIGVNQAFEWARIRRIGTAGGIPQTIVAFTLADQERAHE